MLVGVHELSSSKSISYVHIDFALFVNLLLQLKRSICQIATKKSYESPLILSMVVRVL